MVKCVLRSREDGVLHSFTAGGNKLLQFYSLSAQRSNLGGSALLKPEDGPPLGLLDTIGDRVTGTSLVFQRKVACRIRVILLLTCFTTMQPIMQPVLQLFRSCHHCSALPLFSKLRRITPNSEPSAPLAAPTPGSGRENSKEGVEGGGSHSGNIHTWPVGQTLL